MFEGKHSSGRRFHGQKGSHELSWYRRYTATLSLEAMETLYGVDSDFPKAIAIETGDDQIASSNPAVNAVLYNDVDLSNERNDFFFESLDKAFDFCADTYGITRESWRDLMAWIEIK